MGNVCTAGEGQAPTRQVALGAGRIFQWLEVVQAKVITSELKAKKNVLNR